MHSDQSANPGTELQHGEAALPAALVFSSFPDLLPRPLTPANLTFRRLFYERWGRENAVVMGTATRMQFVPYTQALSVKKCWHGAERFMFEHRRVAVDESSYLVTNAGSTYGFEIASPTPVTSMGVFFRPGMAEEVAAASVLSGAGALNRGAELHHLPCAFGEHVRCGHAQIEPRLLQLRQAVLGGENDPMWLEEALLGLLWAMREAEAGYRRRSLLLSDCSQSTRVELLARVDRAADFLLSCQGDAITLDDVAAAANLSKFHLVRLFAKVHGLTPFEFLARARARTAHALIERSHLTLEQVALHSGFRSRSTMFRQLRKHCGGSGRALRRPA